MRERATCGSVQRAEATHLLHDLIEQLAAGHELRHDVKHLGLVVERDEAHDVRVVQLRAPASVRMYRQRDAREWQRVRINLAAGLIPCASP